MIEAREIDGELWIKASDHHRAIAGLESQEPDYKEALRVLSLALEEAPQNLTPKQRSVWRQSRDVLLSGGGLA
jgi:hypothetical protein